MQIKIMLNCNINAYSYGSISLKIRFVDMF